MSEHFKRVCKHGKLQGQCRCASPDKRLILWGCRDSCMPEDKVLYTGSVGSTARPVSTFEEVFSSFKVETPLTVEGLIRALINAGETIRSDYANAPDQKTRESAIVDARVLNRLRKGLEASLDS